MKTRLFNQDGVEIVHVNVVIPLFLREWAREHGVSLSRELRTVLGKKRQKQEGGAKGGSFQTSSQCIPSNPLSEEVDK